MSSFETRKCIFTLFLFNFLYIERYIHRWRNKEKEREKEERIEGQTKGGIKRKSRGRNRGKQMGAAFVFEIFYVFAIEFEENLRYESGVSTVSIHEKTEAKSLVLLSLLNNFKIIYLINIS